MLLKKTLENHVPSINSPPKIMARALAALIECKRDCPAWFELMRAGTTPILLQPNQRPTYSGRFSMKRATHSPGL